MINKDAPYPLYQQVKELLKKKIISGEWEKGYQLPTEKELGELYDVSTITIKRAILDLVDEGLLYRQRGKGTFVTKKIKTDIQSLVTLKYDKNEEAKHPHRLLTFKKESPNPFVRKALQLKSNQDVYKICRIKLNGNKPVVIEYTYLVADLIPDLTEKAIKDQLLYTVLQNYFSIELKQAKIYFSTSNANETEAALLETPIGERLFVIERYTRTKQNQLIEYSKFIVTQEDYQFYLEVNI